MAIQRTLSIIKPDATKRDVTGKINQMLERSGLRIIAQKRIKLSQEQAEGFYSVHKDRPFYNDLVNFMMSGPVVVQVLEGENAISGIRDMLGPTDSPIAPAGTIRGDMGTTSMKNICHASDSVENAAIEVERFFKPGEVH